jgi:hypothetical protein
VLANECRHGFVCGIGMIAFRPIPATAPEHRFLSNGTSGTSAYPATPFDERMPG